MAKQGVVHNIPHTDEYFNKLRREGRIFRHENFGAYCSTDVGPRRAFNFLEDARKGTEIHMGLNQMSKDPFLGKE